MREFKILNGDSLEVLKQFPDNHFDSIVCDPPYGLSKEPNMSEVLEHWLNDKEYKHNSKGFMGKEWDSFVPSPFIWKECFRVLKEGGHLIAFAGTRTQDLMAVSLRLGGFEIRDMGAWLYGSGFPKSHSISKAIDKKQGNKREVVGKNKHTNSKNHSVPTLDHKERVNLDITKSTSPDGIKWEGYGTSLKPAIEPFTIARKPFKGSVADNVLKNGVGGINIDGCRVNGKPRTTHKDGNFTGNKKGDFLGKELSNHKADEPEGRFPANLIHDGSDPIVDILGEKTKYFYCPKASKKDRNEGLDDFEDKFRAGLQGADNQKEDIDDVSERFRTQPAKNNHPTVKPTDLMAYLCRLITPEGGTILDPFAGSGSTGKAAIREGFNFVGIELDADYCKIAKARIQNEIDKTQE